MFKKCMSLLNTERFKKVTTDPTAATDRKIQKVLRNPKSNLSNQEYHRLNPKMFSTRLVLRYSQDTQVKKQ